MKHFYVFLLFIFVQQINAEGEIPEKHHGQTTTNPIDANSSPANEIKKNLNVIMFVADVPENYTFNKKLKDIWNFDLTKTMKPCNTKRRSIKLKRVSRRKKTICECEASFKQNLLSLMDWARESAGMLTAVASLTEHGYSDAISSETNQNGEHFGFNYFNFKLQDPNDSSEKEDFIQFPLQVDKDTNNENVPDLVSSEDNNVPVIRACPKAVKFDKNFKIKKRFWSPYKLDTIRNTMKLAKYDVNPRQKSEDKFSTESDSVGNKEMNENPQKEKETQNQSTENSEKGMKLETTTNYIMQPEEHSTNNIVEFTDKTEKTTEDIFLTNIEPSPKEPSSVEELSDIMSSIKKQFFHNMMEEQQTGEEQEPFKQPTMKELVRITFNQTFEAKRAYLFLFLGTNVSSLSNPNSDLSESLQYLIDNAKESNTVIIISGGCVSAPKEKDENDEMEDSKDTNVVPLFALGPDSEADYKNVDDLCNLPEAVRSSIDRHKPKKRDLTYQFVSYF